MHFFFSSVSLCLRSSSILKFMFKKHINSSDGPGIQFDVCRAHDIGALPLRSRKTKQETSDVYKQERWELIRKILGYKDCCKVYCNIIMHTCLRMPTLILLPAECMRWYHKPCLQDLFTHKYPNNGFGFVQPRGDLRLSIVPLDFRWLPALATKVLQTLTREDLTPRPTLDKSTDTEATAQVNWLHMQSPDPDILRQAVLEMLAEGGHHFLLSPDIEEYPSDER